MKYSQQYVLKNVLRDNFNKVFYGQGKIMK